MLARPARWVGSRGTAAAIACLAAGALLLTAAASEWSGIQDLATSATACARQGSVHPCETSGGLSLAILGTLLGPALAAAGLLAAATGAACLLRPQGRLDGHGQRLLDDAARHHAAGGLSVEGFQATRDRLHGHAARRLVPQVALTLSLFGASLAILAFLLAGSLLALAQDLRGLGAASLPGTRTILGATGACAAAAVAGAFLVLTQASRWRSQARTEASALQQMLADLESDILDEVRRSAPPTEPAASEP